MMKLFQMKERVPKWLRVLVSETLQEEGDRKSNWKIWSDLKKLTVPNSKAFYPQRVRCRIERDSLLGLMGNGMLSSPKLLGLFGRSSQSDEISW